MNNQKPNEENMKQDEEQKTGGKSNLAGKMEAVGWGLFFIWIGIVFLLNLGVGAGLLGVGFITLGMQVARKNYNLELEKFWGVVGLLFVVGGLWEVGYFADLRMDMRGRHKPPEVPGKTWRRDGVFPKQATLAKSVTD